MAPLAVAFALINTAILYVKVLRTTPTHRKTDSKGDVHYEAWKQPRLAAHGQEQPMTVLTKPKILTVTITLRVEELRNCPMRYVLSAADYQRLISAVA